MDLWTAADWAGRIVLVVFFIMSGFTHLAKRQAMTAYAQSKHIPFAGPAVVVTGLMMLAGAVLILLNWHPLWGATLLVAFLVPTAFLMHNFWVETDPMQKANQQAHFWKNLTIASLVILYAVSVHRM